MLNIIVIHYVAPRNQRHCGIISPVKYNHFTQITPYSPLSRKFLAKLQRYKLYINKLRSEIAANKW